MHYSDHGSYFDGYILDARPGLHKWAQEHSQPRIDANVGGHLFYTFICVGNPYRRILSSFFDKICGIQRNGQRSCSPPDIRYPMEAGYRTLVQNP
jgi:hypothetical protein